MSLKASFQEKALRKRPIERSDSGCFFGRCNGWPEEVGRMLDLPLLPPTPAYSAEVASATKAGRLRRDKKATAGRYLMLDAGRPSVGFFGFQCRD